MPRPRPEIIGTQTPSQASSGASTSEVLSPMPPVLCLSTRMGSYAFQASMVPLWSIASVSAAVSSGVMPWKKMAIARELI